MARAFGPPYSERRMHQASGSWAQANGYHRCLTPRDGGENVQTPTHGRDARATTLEAPWPQQFALRQRGRDARATISPHRFRGPKRENFRGILSPTLSPLLRPGEREKTASSRGLRSL